MEVVLLEVVLLEVSLEVESSGGRGRGGMLSSRLSSISDLVQTYNNVQYMCKLIFCE